MSYWETRPCGHPGCRLEVPGFVRFCPMHASAQPPAAPPYVLAQGAPRSVPVAAILPDMTKEEQAEASREFAKVINRLCLERFSNTPDYVLAEHLVWSLLDFNATIKARSRHLLSEGL